MREVIIVGDQMRDRQHPTEPLWCWNRQHPCWTCCTAWDREPQTSKTEVAICNALRGTVLGIIVEEEQP